MKALKTLIEECRAGEADYQSLIDRVPYARFLGIQVVAQGDELTFVLPKHDNVVHAMHRVLCVLKKICQRTL